MTTSQPRPLRQILAAMAVAAAGLTVAARASNATVVSAGDPRVCYDGRIDFSNRDAPVLIWEGTQVGLDFSGDDVRVLLGSATGQNYFDASVDGKTALLAVPEGADSSFELRAPGPAAKRHHLVLFKRSEASVGIVQLVGFELDSGAEAWRPAPGRNRLRVEFLGDSITVGACNEDGPVDQWDNHRTHDFALSYAALTARALGADLRCTAVSGMGVAIGWAKPLAGQVWDRLYPDADSPRADLKAWTPDIVFINFGENDGSFPAAHHQPFPGEAFTTAYEALVHAVRAAYPQAEIVLLRGGMYNGATNAALRKAWERAVAELEAGDAKVAPFVFQHWTKTHPRVPDDRIMAEELETWVRRQPFWRF